jgi:tetratricopeptide (TPR) repeat protein
MTSLARLVRRRSARGALAGGSLCCLLAALPALCAFTTTWIRAQDSAPPAADGWRPHKQAQPAPSEPTKQDVSSGPDANGWHPASGRVKQAGFQQPDTDGLERLPPPRTSAPAARGDIKVQPPAILSAARNAVARNDLEVAIARFEEYLAQFPADNAVRREYAGVLVQASQRAKALEQYRQLLAVEPENLELRAALAELYLLLREYQNAIPLLQQALAQAPRDLEMAAKLAHAHAQAGEVLKAVQVYERYLARLKPGDARVPRSLALVLLDLEKPRQALAYLAPLRQKSPENVDYLILEIRAYAMLEERDKALELIGELTLKAPRALSARLGLADALAAASEFELALVVFEQVLGSDPASQEALIGAARMRVALFQPEPALQLLAGLKPAESLQRRYALALAAYHQLVGEYAEAKQIHRDLLSKDEEDDDARLALAAVYEYTRDYEKARAEYLKVFPHSSFSRQARLGLARTLAEQLHFPESIDLCKSLLADNPYDADALARLAQNLTKTHHADQAEALCHHFLKSYPLHGSRMVTVRLTLGQVLFSAQKYEEAAQEFAAVLAEPGGKVPEAFYGLVRVQDKLGLPEKAQHILFDLLGADPRNHLGGDARLHLLLADLFSTDYEDARVLDIARGVLSAHPQNLAAMIRLVDSQQRLARQTGHIDETVQTAQQILAASPTNVRGHLALARAFAIAEKYKASVAEYDQLIVIDPDFDVAKREKARVLYAAHQFELAHAAYLQGQTPRAEELLETSLAAYAQSEPRVHEVLQSFLMSGLPTPVLAGEVAKLASHSEPAVQNTLNRILADYNARLTVQSEFHLEGEAKSKKDLRNYEAIPIYKNLIALEPINTEALFDLGQVYSVLRQTHNAIAEYGQVLQVDPEYREAMIAGERASAELSPQARLGFDMFQEHGRMGLANINRYLWSATAIVPYGNENEFFSLGYTRALYAPGGADDLDGNIISARVQKMLGERALFYGQANFEEFENRFHDRVTFDTGAWYDVVDWVRLRGSGYLQNVALNAETLRQDIYRGGVIVGADARPTRYWDFGGSYVYAHYSDNNDLSQIDLRTGVNLSLPPKQLRVVADLDYQTFAQQTVFPFGNPNILVGDIHPYFSPASFAYYEARIEWYHWLSRDYFAHSNQLWYSLQYAIGWDSNLKNYNTFRFILNYDIKSWLSVGADTNVTLSPVYDATTFLGYVLVRFPWFYK